MTRGSRLRAICSLAALRMVMLLALLTVTNAAAWAEDFVLNYAIDAAGKTDTGKLENCSYERVCEIRAAGLMIKIVVRPDTTGLPTMDMNVLGPPGCCYTNEAAEQFHAKLTTGLLRVPIYRRVMRERDEFVRNPFSWNERIGMIYLTFSHPR
ncbi:MULTISPECIES: hypothetical protein [unclassified Bradyrhizobium]|uniref:hypothetical protein n=1 Tax=unclassified Bradyrhizobium TaxID=2631580 RepID=UPI0028EC1198|nr:MULTISPECIES: hypothetical protein [unclassified Bradyrhizobium]